MAEFTTDNLSTVWSRSFSMLVDHGEGAYLYDAEGRQYLDFTSGIGVTNTGHAHPRVVAAIREQAGKLLHAQANIVYHKPMLELVAELLEIVPKPLDTFFFTNSGAEAVESAVKLAKQASGRPNVVVFQGSFHGRTHLTMAMTTSKTIYRSSYQPLVPGIFVAPFPYSYHYGWDDQTTLDFSLTELRRLFKSQTAPEETACIVVEPVLGEGGYVVPPSNFLSELRRLCDEYGILMVADEIQTGFGRTGEFFACQHAEIAPDILIMAKGIASGLPLSGLAASSRLMSKWKPGTHGSTFGGNIVACAAGVATIQTLREEKLVENAALRGKQLLLALKELQAEFPAIGDVRGLGLMAATEFGPRDAPDSTMAKTVQKAAFDDGLLLLTCGTYDNIIRWIPPLIVTEQQIVDSTRIFADALSKAGARKN